MTSKDFFQQVLRAREELSVIQEEKRQYMETALSLGGAPDTTIRTSDNHSRTETAAIRLAELCEKLEEQAKQYVATLEKARELIRRVQSLRQRQVLTLRYLCGYDWNTIQQKMEYQDIKSAFRVHGWALQAANVLLQSEKDCDMIQEKEG